MLAIAAILLEDDDEDIVVPAGALLHRKRFMREISNPFIIGDEVFRKLYRMSPHVAIILIEMLRPHLSEHERGVPIHLQVLATLRFFAEGSYQKGIGQDMNHPMAQSTFSKYLHQVVAALLEFADEFITFPRNRVEREAISRRFEASIGFPGVLGAVDCTLINLHTPVDHEEAYVDHNQRHSLNVQVVSDMDYNILNIRIVNGSSNDRFVWAHSDMRDRMYELRLNPPEEDVQRYYLIGDSGYTPSPVLLTPCRGPIREIGESAYNYSHQLRRTRCKIEQLFGIWKQVLRCLHEDRSLHYAPGRASRIIMAAAVLYNFMRHQGQPMPLPPPVLFNEQYDEDVEAGEEYVEGLEERQRIIDTYFTL